MKGFFDYPLECTECHATFLDIESWADKPDLRCGDCSDRWHAARIAAMNEGRSYTVDSMGGACPTQAEGLTASGRPYYFRARHGEWALHVGSHGDEDGVGGEVVASGEDETQGWMKDDAVLSILDEHCTDS